MTRKTTRRRFLTGCAVGCGLVIALFVLGVVWLGRLVTSQPAEIELTDHHPFRSPAAKERYLARYDERARAWPVPSETRMVDTSWGSTFVRVSGPAEAPPLVLLPGANATSLQWLPNIAALSRERRTYAVDNICDFGRSVYRRRFTSAGDFVAWLDELGTALELGDDTALMGLSYGGWITAQYALARPERLSHAVLLAPAGTVQPLSAGFLKRAILAAIPHRFFTRNLIHWLVADSLEASDALRGEIDEFVEDGYLGLRTFKVKQLVNPTVLSDDELASIAVPTLFLVGENERIYSAAEAIERLERVAPAIEAEIVPGAGHDLTLVRADLVNARVVAFLARPEPDSTGP